MSFPASFDLADLDGKNGFVINGVGAGYASGGSVSNAGDFNGDGFDDILIGSFGGDISTKVLNIGSHVVFGSEQGFSSSLDLSDLNGSNGFTLQKAFDETEILSVLGYWTAYAGDINGDGLDDILIGAEFKKALGTRDEGVNIYAVFGSDQGFESNFNLSNLNGENGFSLKIPELINPYFNSNDFSLSTAGDFDGDGFDDILIGEREPEFPMFGINGPPIGKQGDKAYLVFGNDQGFSPSLELSSANFDGSKGLVFNGTDERTNFAAEVQGDAGRRVSSAGDFNGDGFDDILITARGFDPNSNNFRSASEIYLIFGSNQGFDSSIELSRSNFNGNNGFVLNGADSAPPDSTSVVSSAGDINGDGFDDILIGQSWVSPNGDSRTGQTHVVFGSDQDFESSLDLASLDGNNGFIINGIDEGDRSGHWVSNAGDFNGDGLDDILIGAVWADPNENSRAGETYLIFGNARGFKPSIELGELNGKNGFVLNGIDEGDLSGHSVSSAGDINSDGFDDIVIGAPMANPNNNQYAGETYVVLGRSSHTAIEWDTETGIVSSFGISLSAGKASTTPIGRTIQDKNWELQTTGDLNGDGQADVILRHALAGQLLTWTMAPGGQSIQSEAIIGRELSDTNWSIGGTGDLNGDGNTDLILRNQAADQMVAWYMDGKGSIQSEELIGRGFGDNNWKIEVMADFNGDGKSDLVLRNRLSGQHLLWEMEGGTILAETLIGRDIPDQNWHIEGARDFDNNGTVDLFLRHRGVGQGLLWSMADQTTIASEQLISNVLTETSQLIF